MPHREPITFPEISKAIFESRDGPKPIRYPSDVQKRVVNILAKVTRAKEELREIQRDCNHLRAVRNLAPARSGEFQCQDCGITRNQPFGAYIR